MPLRQVVHLDAVTDLVWYEHSWYRPVAALAMTVLLLTLTVWWLVPSSGADRSDHIRTTRERYECLKEKHSRILEATQENQNQQNGSSYTIRT